MLACAAHVPGKAYAGTKVTIIVMRQSSGSRMANCLQGQVSTIQRLTLSADQIEILVPTHPEVERQIATELPVILEVEAQHLRPSRKIEVRIAGRCRHATHNIGRCKFRGKPNYAAGKGVEIDLQGGIKLKEAAKFWLPQIIEASSEGMVASSNREVILELVLCLVRLLRHVGVRAKGDASWECKCRNLLVGVNQVVPVLITDSSSIDDGTTKHRIQSNVSQ